MCHIIKRDTAAAVRAALLRPTDLSQLLSRQHVANLREGRLLSAQLRGNMSVTVSGSQLSEQTCLHLRCQTPSAALCTLLEVWHSGRRVIPQQETHINGLCKTVLDETVQYRYMRFHCNQNPAGSVFEKVAK